MRGLAILAVLLYHCYSLGPEIDGLYTRRFSAGYLGVQLFFLLSGFLIFHSLETSRSLGHFLYRRWVRLLPAMLAASWLIYESSIFLYDRMNSLPGYLDVLPGVLFIDPHWLRDIFHLPVTGPIEGDFWTLFTEVKFYLLFGCAFFLWRRKAALVLAGLAGWGMVVYLLQTHGVNFDTHALGRAAVAFSDEINCRCYGWFAAGAYFYLYFDTGKRSYLAASAGCALSGVLADATLTDAGDILIIASVYLIFAGSFFWGALKRFFSTPAAVFLGFISYPLYLLHQNITWALALKLHHELPQVPAKLVMVFPIALAGLLAWLTAAFLEPWGRRLLGAGRRAKDQGRPPLCSGGAAACLLFAGLAAASVTASLYHPIRRPRLILEAQILDFEKATLEPLERELAQSQRALSSARETRLKAQAYLAAMKRSGR